MKMMTQQIILKEFNVIKLTGEQSHEFLQGQVTNDVNQLSKIDWQAGVHCNAKGKAWSTFFAFEKDKDIYLIMVADSAAQSLAEFNKYAVFSKTDITDDTAQWSITGVLGEPTTDNDEAKVIALSKQHSLVLSHSANADEVAENQSTSNEASRQQWWYHEISSGRAHLHTPMIGEYVPQMMNLQALGYISFSKGCYMGQEMVARMRYLGKNKRALFIAELDDVIALSPGQDVYREMSGNRRKSGKIIQSQSFDGRTVFQAVLPNDTELTETIYLNEENNTSATLRPLPYSLKED